ncbi:MAG: hypothetical protein QOJ35_773 [Solirubrobacteraceae bacterium]|nr:hypothetical protein [Solirubrobacteraceae bacterium]
MAGALALAGCGAAKTSKPATTAATTPASGVELGPPFGSMDALPGILKTRPPWSANTAKLQLRLRAIGLPALTAEGQVVHIHQHLDVLVAGKPVTVADNVGIDPAGGFISPLHTHAGQPDIIHVESSTESRFSLGQFFAVWGVRLDANCIGGACAGGANELRAWVDGKPVPGDPTRIVLAEHEEIVIAYGTAKQLPNPVPSSYAFPEGL